MGYTVAQNAPVLISRSRARVSLQSLTIQTVNLYKWGINQHAKHTTNSGAEIHRRQIRNNGANYRHRRKLFLVYGRVEKTYLPVTLRPVRKDGLVRDVLVEVDGKGVGDALHKRGKLHREMHGAVRGIAREGSRAGGRAAVRVTAGLKARRVDGGAVVPRAVDGYFHGGANHLCGRPCEGGVAIAEKVYERERPANAL